MLGTLPERPTLVNKLLDKHIEIFVGAIFHAYLQYPENVYPVIASYRVCR